jgi:hypothetical protein
MKLAKFCAHGGILQGRTLMIFKVSSTCTSWFVTVDGEAKLWCVSIIHLIINETYGTICSSHKILLSFSSKFRFYFSFC